MSGWGRGLVAVVVVVVAAGAAAAQGSGPAAGRIEEIVVTAQKRSEDIQDVPISMAALTSDFVQAAGLTSFEGLQQYVPNLSITQPVDSRSTAVRIRGIGADGNNAGIDPSVGVFVDGIYQGRTGLVAASDLADIERIEVLRGPQGTLYGKNTAAGALSIVTKKPSLDTIESFAEGVYGNYANREVRGSIGVPLILDQLGIRMSGYWVKRDPFDRNVFDDEGRNNANRAGFRVKTLWRPTEGTEAQLWLDYARQSDRCCAADILSFDGAPALDVTFRQMAEALGRPVPVEDPFDRVLGADQLTQNSSRILGVAGQVDQDLWGHRLTLLTGYRKFKSASRADADFSEFDAVFSSVSETFQQVSAELRLTSLEWDDFEYVAGLYFYYQEDATQGRIGIGPDWFAASSLGDAFTALGQTDENGRVVGNDTNVHETWSYAFFGQGTYRFSDAWSLTVGLRGTYERKRRVGSQISGLKSIDQGPFGPDIYYGVECVQDPSTTTEPICADAERLSVFNLSPMASLQYFPTEDSMVFLRFARGFKSGGFNQLRTPAGRDTQFDDEIASDLEFGVRTSWLDRMVTANATFFHTWYEDFQSQVIDGNTILVTNAGSLRSYGVEADVMVVPHPALVLGSSLGWNVAKYSSFANAPCTAQQDFDLNEDMPTARIGCSQDLSGQDLDNAPEWTTSTFAQLTLPLPQLADSLPALLTYLRAEHSFREQVFLSQDLDPGLLQPSVHLVNLRAGLQTEDGGVELVGWAKNLTNERYNVVGFDIPVLSGFAGINAPPRQYGVTLRFRF